MITQAHIHEYGNGKLEPEQADVKATLEARGIECKLFTTKRLHRNQLTLNANTLIVADHPTMEAVFKRIGYQHTLNSYPTSLRPYLKRTVWESTVGKLLASSQSGTVANIFIKPKSKAKLFTGFVVESVTDLYSLHRMSKHTKLHCSSVVAWASEYRVYVTDGTIVGVKHYEGDPEITLNMAEVERAVADLEASEERTRAYGIDFGVLSTGETALIEWNDGFALGSYGLEAEVYTDLIVARWEEIAKAAFA